MGSYSGAIAHLLAQGIPETYSDNIQTLEAMTEVEQHTLSAAYIYSRKVPRDDQQDMFQELVSRILGALERRELAGATTLLYPKAYTLKVARYGWISWLKSRVRESMRIPFEESEVQDTPERGMIEAIEAELGAQRIWRGLPADIQAIIRKRFDGESNTSSERVKLHKYLWKNGDHIRDLAGLAHSYGKRPKVRWTHCKRGHPLCLANTYVAPGGSRECRICRKERVRRHRERKREKEYGHTA